MSNSCRYGYFILLGILSVGCNSAGNFNKSVTAGTTSAQGTAPSGLQPTSVPTSLPSSFPSSFPPSSSGNSTPAGVPGAPNAGVMPASGVVITPSGTSWYVRTDGGTAAQCNGKTDHSLAGASGQNCAFSNPHYLWGNDVAGETPQWKIAGGDTVILKEGPYRIGYKSNTGNASDAWGQCQGNNTGCTMPPIPAGTTSVHTKILGENYSNCTTKTQLHGGYGLSYVMNLTQTQHVDVACLEITDYASCSRVGVGSVCYKNFPGWDDYSDTGIQTDVATTDVNLIDLDIHGMGGAAIDGPIGALVSVNHVRMHANGDAGWNFDDGSDSPMAPGAQVNASYLVVEYSGCTEEYPIVNSNPVGICYDQAAGGWAYGDGVGTSDTQLSFTCDHCNFNHNTQDGFDLLHTSGSVISITNSLSYANEGQQFKLGPMNQVTFTDNVVIGNCHRMAQAIAGTTPGFNAGLNEPPGGNDVTDSRGYCRADATAMSLSFIPGGNYIFQNNTLIAYGDIAWSMACNSGDCSGAKIVFQNNVNVAYPYPNGQLTKQMTAFNIYPGITDSNFTRSNNIYYNFRNTVCPSSFGVESCGDPVLASIPTIAYNGFWSDETQFDNMDLHPQSVGPAWGSGLSIPGITTHYDGTSIGSVFNIGAY